MNTEPMPKCPQCGKLLPPDAPDGLCPQCVMVMNLKTETAFSGDMPAAQPPLPPEQIAPHFPQLEILECLGRGGMGVVYKARQKTLNRFVALKLLAPERVQDAKFAGRFAREAQALAALNHPNIVTIHDFGQAGGFYFLLMEFVDGLNLRQLLRARKFTPEEALAIVPPLCDALQFAHDRGIVHRDIKPENLLLDKTGRVKVADFGIAKMLGTVNGGNGGETAAPENATQTAVGTPSYSAPEQKTDPQHVDSRADIYSLGVVFYEMLTGELPGKKILPPSTKVQIDVRLDEIVLRALEKKPELRYQQVGEVKTCLETIVRSATTPSTGTAGKAFDQAANVAPGRALPEPRFSRAKMAMAIAVVLAAATAAIVIKTTFFPAPPDSYFLPDYGHFQRLPSGLFILRPTHFSTPINGLDYSCETDSPAGEHVTWNMGRNRTFAQLLCRLYNCVTNQIVLPPGAPPEHFDYLYTVRDPNGLGYFEAAIKKLGYTAHWENQPVRMLVVEKVAASTPSGQNAADGDWIWEPNSQTLGRVPPMFLLRPSTLPANADAFDLFGKDRYLARGQTLQKLIATVWSQKNSSLKIVFAAGLPEDKYDFIVAGDSQWYDSLQADLDRRFHLVEQLEYRDGSDVVVVKNVSLTEEVARLNHEISQNELEIAKVKFKAEVLSPAGSDLSPSNMVALMQRAYATIYTYRDSGWTVCHYNDDVWTNKFSELLDRRKLYRIEVVTAAHPFSHTNRWWSDGDTEFWQPDTPTIYKNSSPATEGGNISLVSQDSTVPALFFNLNWGNLLETMSFSSAAELVRRPDEVVSGVDCYVLERANIGLTVWVGKQDFLIRRYRNFISKDRVAELRKHSPHTNALSALPASAETDQTTIQTFENVIVNEALKREDFIPPNAGTN